MVPVTLLRALVWDGPELLFEVDLAPFQSADFGATLARREQEPDRPAERAHVRRCFPDRPDLGFGQDTLALVLRAKALESGERRFAILDPPVILAPLAEGLQVGGDPPRVGWRLLGDCAQDVVCFGSRDLCERPGAEPWLTVDLADDVFLDHAIDDVERAVPAVTVDLALFDIGGPCLLECVLGLT